MLLTSFDIGRGLYPLALPRQSNVPGRYSRTLSEMTALFDGKQTMEEGFNNRPNSGTSPLSATMQSQSTSSSSPCRRRSLCCSSCGRQYAGTSSGQFTVIATSALTAALVSAFVSVCCSLAFAARTDAEGLEAFTAGRPSEVLKFHAELASKVQVERPPARSVVERSSTRRTPNVVAQLRHVSGNVEPSESHRRWQQLRDRQQEASSFVDLVVDGGGSAFSDDRKV